jgi:phage shock protein A
MSVFERWRNLMKGKLEMGMSKIEQNNPAAVYEAAIAERTTRWTELRGAVAGLARQRDQTKDQIDALERELRGLLPAVAAAARSEGEDEDAVALLTHKLAIEDKLTALREQHTSLETQVDEGKAALTAYREDLRALEAERDVAVAQHATATARVEANDLVSGLSDDAASEGLSSVRDHIDAQHRRAHDGWLDSEGNSVRGRAEALTEKARTLTAADQLAAMKRELAARRGDAPAPDAPDADSDAPEEAKDAGPTLPPRTL